MSLLLGFGGERSLLAGPGQALLEEALYYTTVNINTNINTIIYCIILLLYYAILLLSLYQYYYCYHAPRRSAPLEPDAPPRPRLQGNRSITYSA